MTVDAIANHLWQSTFFAVLCATAALALRKNPASVRHGIWLAASLKFLIPFSLLTAFAGELAWRTAPAAILGNMPAAVVQVSQPFSDGLLIPHSTLTPPSAHSLVPTLAAAAWLAGGLALLGVWFTRWMRVRSILRTATPLPREGPIPVLTSATVLEPGVFGIFRPVLLLPEGIAGRLTPAQLSAILAHELCHVRRRDNLSAAIHMLVEAAFWFHPLVWWIGARLVDERERACDEDVLRLGNEPEAYAEGILHVCKLYLRSSLPCASGVTGSDLKKRIEAIMTQRLSQGMTRARMLMLAAAGAVAVIAPIVIGAVHAQDANLVFEVASIKASDPANMRGMNISLLPGGGLRITGGTLHELVTFAYDVLDVQLAGGPPWMKSANFDLLAKPARPETTDLTKATYQEASQVHERQRQRLRALLAERFNLQIHHETKELPAYVLVAGRNGPKFQKADPDAKGNFRIGAGLISAEACTMDILVMGLRFVLRSPVLDRTSLTGVFNYKLEWTPDRGVVPSPAEPLDPAVPSLFTVIQEQLGLRLEATKGPVDTIVIDRAEKPTEN